MDEGTIHSTNPSSLFDLKKFTLQHFISHSEVFFFGNNKTKKQNKSKKINHFYK